MILKSSSIEEHPLKQLDRWVWRSWNASSPTGGRSAAVNWTELTCKPARARLRDLQGVLEQGSSCAHSKAATFCANLLALYPALWLFTTIEGVEPTNNHAERVLRLGVLWCKNDNRTTVLSRSCLAALHPLGVGLPASSSFSSW